MASARLDSSCFISVIGALSRERIHAHVGIRNFHAIDPTHGRFYLFALLVRADSSLRIASDNVLLRSIHLYSMYGRFDPSKFLTGRFEIPWAVLFFRRGNEVGKANEGSEKSEDNPNTQITILFCSKSLSIIRPRRFHRLLAW